MLNGSDQTNEIMIIGGETNDDTNRKIAGNSIKNKNTKNSALIVSSRIIDTYHK